ncbi:PREDICTED: leucine-rich repeat extensin-like protein 5 [Camelina sativa]|uniref:Leucine-rich repeat extensin-like protein 5 n=1 Tax=Camelina sativa TaxID=90675 RepID=A0ABM0SXM0_CAMSA|nr:PREDICTED: leucine-rich repeat extensin-like protein 5 [Camelina sativa]
MESNRALATICLLLCVIITANFFTHCVDARRQVGIKREPKQVMIKAVKHTSLLEKMMTQLNLAQPLDYSSSSNTQPYGVSTTLTLPPYVSLPPLSVPSNAPPFCVSPPDTPLTSSAPGLTPPPGPITLPNPPDSSSNPNSNPNPPESSSNPNPPESSSNPNPPESSSNPNPPVTVPNPPESSSNPNPPDSSSNTNPPVTVPNPPESSIPNPPETVPNPPETGFTPGPPGPISGPPYSEPSPSTPTDTPTPSGGIPTPTGSIPSPSSGFLPPIVYPPPMGPPSPSANPTSAYWCVAKPSVPDPIILEAMNFACGSGADCHSIQPNGPCFKPNTLWAHASFAFNSYWQRTKGTGGSCTFGGTGMLVTVDPSFNGCHFDFF